MTLRRRVKLSANQRVDMWSRWKAGQSLHEIGRAFGKDHISIQFMLSQHGGIVPGTRRRSLLTLTLAEREDISRIDEPEPFPFEPTGRELGRSLDAFQ